MKKKKLTPNRKRILKKTRCLSVRLTSGRAWRRSWCCRRRLDPAAPGNSAPSAPPGFPSPSPTPAVEKESGCWGAMQGEKHKQKQREWEGEREERCWNQFKHFNLKSVSQKHPEELCSKTRWRRLLRLCLCIPHLFWPCCGCVHVCRCVCGLSSCIIKTIHHYSHLVT